MMRPALAAGGPARAAQQRPQFMDPETSPPIPAEHLDHIGIAVPDLEAACRMYREVFGCEVGPPIDVPAQGIRIAYVTLANARLELMQPTGTDGAVARFLARNPSGGMHHLCLTTGSAAQTAAAATGAGLTVLGSGSPVRGHHGRALYFLSPKDTGGVLVEVEEDHA